VHPIRWPYSHPRTLRAQADVPHTFGTLLIPLALLLVAGGVYQLERTIARPLESDAASILFGSVALACGLLLSLYMFRSLRTAAPSQSSGQANSRKVALAQPSLLSRKSLARETPPPQPFHRHYVDEARISR